MPPVFIAGYDGSERGADAVALAATLACALGARLLVANVYRYDPVPRVGGRDAFQRALAELSEQTLEGAAPPVADVEVTRVAVPATSVAQGLHALAQEERASLVVVGSSHRGRLGRVLAGTTADKLLHGAPCPVAVAPRGFAERAPSLGRVGMAYDGSPEARAALDAARLLAQRLGAELRVLVAAETIHTPAAPLGPAYVEEMTEQAQRLVREAPCAVLVVPRGGVVRLDEQAAPAAPAPS